MGSQEQSYPYTHMLNYLMAWKCSRGGGKRKYTHNVSWSIDLGEHCCCTHLLLNVCFVVSRVSFTHIFPVARSAILCQIFDIWVNVHVFRNFIISIYSLHYYFHFLNPRKSEVIIQFFADPQNCIFFSESWKSCSKRLKILERNRK